MKAKVRNISLLAVLLVLTLVVAWVFFRPTGLNNNPQDVVEEEDGADLTKEVSRLLLVPYSNLSESEQYLVQRASEKERRGLFSDRDELLISTISKVHLSADGLGDVLTEEESQIYTEGIEISKPITGNHKFSVSFSEGVNTQVEFISFAPIDPWPGDEQDVEILVKDPDGVESVQLVINIDGEEETILLDHLGEVVIDDGAPKYFVANGELNVRSDFEILAHKTLNRLTNRANAGSTYQKYVLRRIADKIYDRFYEIKVVIKDKLGNLVPVTYAAVTACPFPIEGSYTVSANCSQNALDGLVNTNAVGFAPLTISAGTMAVTANLYVGAGTGTVNSSPAITMSGGTITMTSNTIYINDYPGGNTNVDTLCVDDGDADNYIDKNVFSNTYGDGSCTAPLRARYLMTNWYKDCDDASVNVYPNSSYYCAWGTYSAWSGCKCISTVSWSGACVPNLTGCPIASKSQCQYRTRSGCNAAGSGVCNRFIDYERNLRGCTTCAC